mgnify:CR=1 FL=1
MISDNMINHITAHKSHSSNERMLDDLLMKAKRTDTKTTSKNSQS